MSFDTDYRDLQDNAPRNPNEALYGPGTAAPAPAPTAQRGAVLELRVAPERHLSVAAGASSTRSSFTAQSGDYFFREVQIRDALNTQRRRSASSRRPAATSGRRSGTTASRSGSRRSATSRSKASLDLFNSLNINTITGADQPQRLDLPAADGDHRRRACSVSACATASSRVVRFQGSRWGRGSEVRT